MPSAEVTLIPGQLITINPNWLTQKQAEISEGEKALTALTKLPGINKWRIAKVKARIAFLKRYVSLLSEGFIPIPRMDFKTIELPKGRSWDGQAHLYLDRMPVQALRNIAQFKGKFDLIGLVKPKAKKRDPILIGIIRHGGMEEHFILYYWRPELYSDSELW